jgi:hypothetical protein
MPKSVSIISKNKNSFQKQELKQFVFLLKLLQRILYVIFHKGEQTKISKSI